VDKRTSNSGPVVLPNATRPERWERKLGVVTTVATVIGIVAWVLYAQNSSNRTHRLASPSGSEFAATAVNHASALDEAPEGMVWIPGGEFSMGANDLPEVDAVGMKATEDARPIHRVYVDGFLMDKTDVTNAQFTNFVRATRYITVAERKPRAEDFPAAPAENLVAGSVVFSPPGHAVSLDDNFQWWRYVGRTWSPPGARRMPPWRQARPLFPLRRYPASAFWFRGSVLARLLLRERCSIHSPASAW
jgi:formylglycine-generating enzyme required for sulfatase activity